MNFKQECENKVFFALKNKDFAKLNIITQIVGINNELWAKWGSQLYSVNIPPKTIDSLIELFDNGFSGSLDVINTKYGSSHYHIIDSNYDYSRMLKYPEIKNIVFNKLTWKYNENINIETINRINPEVFCELFNNPNSFITLENLPKFIYLNRYKLSKEIICKFEQIYNDTNSINIKLYLSNVLMKTKMLNPIEYIDTFDERTTVIIPFTYRRIKQLLSYDDMKTYYAGLYDVELIENTQMLKMILDIERESPYMYVFESYFEDFINNSNSNKYYHLFDLLLEDENVAILFHNKMIDESNSYTKLHLSIYDWILDKRPTWVNFRTKCMQEPKDLV